MNVNNINLISFNANKHFICAILCKYRYNLFRIFLRTVYNSYHKSNLVWTTDLPFCSDQPRRHLLTPQRSTSDLSAKSNVFYLLPLFGNLSFLYNNGVAGISFLSRMSPFHWHITINIIHIHGKYYLKYLHHLKLVNSMKFRTYFEQSIFLYDQPKQIVVFALFWGMFTYSIYLNIIILYAIRLIIFQIYNKNVIIIVICHSFRLSSSSITGICKSVFNIIQQKA